MSATKIPEGWQQVSFAADCTGGDGGEIGDLCSVCGQEYIDCPCPGPTQAEDYEYADFGGVLYAKRREG